MWFIEQLAGRSLHFQDTVNCVQKKIKRKEVVSDQTCLAGCGKLQGPYENDVLQQRKTLKNN